MSRHKHSNTTATETVEPDNGQQHHEEASAAPVNGPQELTNLDNELIDIQAQSATVKRPRTTYMVQGTSRETGAIEVLENLDSMREVKTYLRVATKIVGLVYSNMRVYQTRDITAKMVPCDEGSAAK